MMIKRVTLSGCLLSLFIANAAIAQDRKAEQAIKHRRAAFVLMSTYFSRLPQTVEGDRPFDLCWLPRMPDWSTNSVACLGRVSRQEPSVVTRGPRRESGGQPS